MSGSIDIGDRHRRHVAGLNDEGRAISVRLLAGSLESPWSQHLACCLGNLLCRLVGSVSAVELRLPATRLEEPVGWPTTGATAVEQLMSLSVWATGGVVPFRQDTGSPCDFTVCVGSRPADYGGQIDLFAVGRGWRGWVGEEKALPNCDEVEPGGSNPLGPYLAAAFLAAEIFKRARGLEHGRFATDFGYSLWSGTEGAWCELLDGPEIQGAVLPPFYLIGAGAVGQGLYALMAAARLGGSFVVTIDDDRLDDTNLNRCFVAGFQDLKEPKVQAITRTRTAAGLGGIEFDQTLLQYVQNGGGGARLTANLVASESEDRFGIIVSAVDKNTSRHDIQGLAPDLIVGGSTVGLSAKSNLYDMRPAMPCLACHNPKEDDGARLREVEQRVRGMSEAELRTFLSGSPDDVDKVVEYLLNAETCGQIGEKLFREFATKREPEFSASFVSMTAAVLVAGRLIARLLFPEREPARPTMATISLRSLATGDDALSQDNACEYCAKRAFEGGRSTLHGRF